MEFADKQIAPPKSWPLFEDLCRALFAAVWNDPYTQKKGRAGQPQHGVDVWGSFNRDPTQIHCVQCKGKENYSRRKVTAREFDEELAKAEQFSPTPSHWILTR